MGREIRFRAWDIENKKMLEVVSLGIGFGSSHRCEEQDGEWSVGTHDPGLVIMQWTGLNDLNGVPIYEGDVVAFNEDVGVVKFGEYEDGEQYNIISHIGYYVDFPNDSDGSWEGTLSDIHSTCRVIGNIYEHNDLINHRSV